MELSIYSRPPESISKLIRRKIREIARVFGKNRASKAPLPHITMRSSFKVPKKDFSKIVGKLRGEFRKLKKPVVKIEGWDIAPKSSEVYGFHLDVKKNKDLTNIYRKLERLFPRYKKTFKVPRHKKTLKVEEFFPHISLAWNMKKEMKKEDFEKTLVYLKKKRFSFKKQYKFDKLYIHEKVGKDRYRFVKVVR
jgi:2'-5' RNA ligase